MNSERERMSEREQVDREGLQMDKRHLSHVLLLLGNLSAGHIKKNKTGMRRTLGTDQPEQKQQLWQEQ